MVLLRVFFFFLKIHTDVSNRVDMKLRQISLDEHLAKQLSESNTLWPGSFRYFTYGGCNHEYQIYLFEDS